MTTPLNVLHIIADQHQAEVLGCAGHAQALTPNLDRLAGDGVRFAHAYTQNPICTPSRTSIFSGQYCHNHGYYGLSGPRPAALPSFLSHFKAHGYRTAAIGCVHTPNDPRNWLETHVDCFLDYSESVDSQVWQTPFYQELRDRSVMEQEDNYRFFLHPELSMEGQPSLLPYHDSQEAWASRETIRFIEASDSQPFCLQVAFQRPHQPFTPAREFWELYPDDLALPPTLGQPPTGRPPHFQQSWQWFHDGTGALEPRTFTAMARRLWRGYLGCIAQVDAAVGELLAFLEQSGRAHNTIVIYHADHGGYSGTHGIRGKGAGHLLGSGMQSALAVARAGNDARRARLRPTGGEYRPCADAGVALRPAADGNGGRTRSLAPAARGAPPVARGGGDGKPLEQGAPLAALALCALPTGNVRWPGYRRALRFMRRPR